MYLRFPVSKFFPPSNSDHIDSNRNCYPSQWVIWVTSCDLVFNAASVSQHTSYSNKLNLLHQYKQKKASIQSIQPLLYNKSHGMNVTDINTLKDIISQLGTLGKCLISIFYPWIHWTKFKVNIYIYATKIIHTLNVINTVSTSASVLYSCLRNNRKKILNGLQQPFVQTTNPLCTSHHDAQPIATLTERLTPPVLLLGQQLA